MRAASFPLLTILCLLLAVAPAVADTTVYSNGPYNGNTDAWEINFGFSVSDSITMPRGGYFEDLYFVYWGSATDVLTSVDLAVGSTSFGGTPQTPTGVRNTLLGTNNFGFALFEADATFATIYWSGSGYVTLSNACTISGCSISTPVYWDENGGPSTAYENTLGSIPSESFTLTGCLCCGAPGPKCGPPVPEPSSIMLFASGVLGVLGVLRRKLNR